MDPRAFIVAGRIGDGASAATDITGAYQINIKAEQNRPKDPTDLAVELRIDGIQFQKSDGRYQATLEMT